MARLIPDAITERAKARFWAMVDVRGPDDCWEWTGFRNAKGYARFYYDKQHGTFAAHRFSLHLAGRPVPEGLVTDHLCRNPPCVNPAHLEAVSNRENTTRGNAGLHRAAECQQMTHCKRGHPFDEANTVITSQGYRRCQICHLAGEVERRMRAKEAERERSAMIAETRDDHRDHLAMIIRKEAAERTGGGAHE